MQAQVCHERKALYGTYAARVRFSDQPASGAGGDPVIQAFHAASPLRHDFDPEFSQVDWQYLANGGRGSEKTRLYAIAWQPAILNFLGYSVGMAVGAWLAFELGMGPRGVWWGLVAGLVLVALALGWRVHHRLGGELQRLVVDVPTLPTQ